MQVTYGGVAVYVTFHQFLQNHPGTICTGDDFHSFSILELFPPALTCVLDFEAQCQVEGLVRADKGFHRTAFPAAADAFHDGGPPQAHAAVVRVCRHGFDIAVMPLRLVKHPANRDELAIWRGHDDFQLTISGDRVEHFTAHGLIFRVDVRIARVIESAVHHRVNFGPIGLFCQAQQLETLWKRDHRKVFRDFKSCKGSILPWYVNIAPGLYQCGKCRVRIVHKGMQAAVFGGEMGFSVIEHLASQVLVAWFKLEEGFTQAGFIIGHCDDLPLLLPDADPVQVVGVQGGMTVHVLPGGFQPIAIAIARLVVGDQECTDILVVFSVLVISKPNGHIFTPLQHPPYGIFESDASHRQSSHYRMDLTGKFIMDC